MTLTPELAALSAADKLELAAALVKEAFGAAPLTLLQYVGNSTHQISIEGETLALLLDERAYDLRWEGIEWRTCPSCQERDTAPAVGANNKQTYTCEHCGHAYTEDEY